MNLDEAYSENVKNMFEKFKTKNQPIMQQMTDEQRMRVIMCYPNAQPVGLPFSADPEDWEGYGIYSYCKDGTVQLIHSDHGICGIDMKDLQIVLRPVSSLTDEECIEVARILLPTAFERRTRGWQVTRDYLVTGWPYIKIHHKLITRSVQIDCKLINFDVDVMEDRETGSCDMKPAQIIDYLRSINIITTVHGFDLVAEGIAIVQETKII